MNDYASIHTLADIRAAIARRRDTGIAAWNAIDPDVFCSPLGDAWSPADNVRHLTKSTRPLTQALRMPYTVLRAMFGRPERPSSTFDELVARYRQALAAGGNAGRFAPSVKPVPDDRVGWRRDVVQELDDSLAQLDKAIEQWRDDLLDEYLLPHPLLGKLTVREMLMFAVYHLDHHWANVEGRYRTLARDA